MATAIVNFCLPIGIAMIVIAMVDWIMNQFRNAVQI